MNSQEKSPNPSLDEIAAHPELVADLNLGQRSRLILRLSGVLAALGVVADADDRNGKSPERLLTAQQTAARLGHKASYIYELARRGQIRSVRKGKYVRIPESAIDEYIEKNQTGPTGAGFL